MSDSASRRHFLKSGLVLIPAVTLAPQTVFSSTPAEGGAEDKHSGERYAPRFFSSAEWAFINAATERLIPQDELGPGAVACGIPEFIDRQMETPYAYGLLWYMQGPFLSDLPAELGYQQKLTPREIYRFGIKACDDWCISTHAKVFAQLPADTQIQILHQLEAGTVAMNELSSALFFAQLLKTTKEGYFADPLYGGNRKMAGWRMIGFPGARADYMDWVDHPNEHYPLGAVSIDGQRA